MGRKKGKQRGNFSTKIQRAEAGAAAVLQHHPNSSFVDPRYTGTSSSGRSTYINSNKSQLQRLREERGTVSLTQLRGLLRERRIEDTLEYQAVRRRNMTRSTSGPCRSHDATNEVKQERPIPRNPPGYILNYSSNAPNGRGEGGNQSDIPSLQSLCVDVLGPNLDGFIEAYGVGLVRAVLDGLPQNILTFLSISASRRGGVDDNLITVLGIHNHVERLALHAKAGKVTARGILSIVPRMITQTQICFSQACEYSMESSEENEVLDSWEDSLSCTATSIQGCSKVTRLELCNLDFCPFEEDEESEAGKDLANAVLKLLKLCPRITHLSLAGSNASYECGYELLRLLAISLHKLQAVDLSHCKWMDNSLLQIFLLMIARSWERRERDAIALRIVDVSGCPNISPERCRLEERKYRELANVNLNVILNHASTSTD